MYTDLEMLPTTTVHERRQRYRDALASLVAAGRLSPHPTLEEAVAALAAAGVSVHAGALLDVLAEAAARPEPIGDPDD